MACFVDYFYKILPTGYVFHLWFFIGLNLAEIKRIQSHDGNMRINDFSFFQNSRHIYICEFHKAMIQTVRVKRKR